MTIKGGYWGKILSIDLTCKKVEIKEFGNDFAKKYLGGVGLATKLISDKVTKKRIRLDRAMYLYLRQVPTRLQIYQVPADVVLLQNHLLQATGVKLTEADISGLK